MPPPAPAQAGGGRRHRPHTPFLACHPRLDPGPRFPLPSAGEARSAPARRVRVYTHPETRRTPSPGPVAPSPPSPAGEKRHYPAPNTPRCYRNRSRLTGENFINTSTSPAASTSNHDPESPGSGNTLPSSAELTNPKSNAASHSTESRLRRRWRRFRRKPTALSNGHRWRMRAITTSPRRRRRCRCGGAGPLHQAGGDRRR